MWVRLARRLMLVGIAGVWLCVLPVRSGAQVDIHVGIQLPPPLVFSAPPEVVVLPGTYVYAVPDIDEDVFFFDGWWWRPWGGHWYRSRSYERGWNYYSRAPSFYRQVPQDWRHDYRDHQWGGRPWNYERLPHEHVEKNWNTWKREQHWEKQQTWGVQGFEPQRHGHDRPPQAPRSERHDQRPPQQSERHGQPPHASHQAGHDQHPQAKKQQSHEPENHQGGHGQENHGQDHGGSSKHHDGKEKK